MTVYKGFTELGRYQELLSKYQQRAGEKSAITDQVAERRRRRSLLLHTILLRKMYGRLIERIDGWVRIDLIRIERDKAKSERIVYENVEQYAHLLGVKGILTKLRQENGDALLRATFDLQRFKVSPLELKEILSVTDVDWQLYRNRYGKRAQNLADLIFYADPVLYEQINAAAIRGTERYRRQLPAVHEFV